MNQASGTIQHYLHTDYLMTDYDWAAERGDKWLAQISPLEAMLTPVDAPLLAALNLGLSNNPSYKPLRLADIACGGGGTAFELEKMAPRDSDIDGFDISRALVDFANDRAKKNHSSARFQMANMQTTQLSGEAYDCLISRFGTMFFDNPNVAFNNIRGWLKPEAQFAFAVWGSPKRNPWITIPKDIASQHIEVPKTEHDSPGPFRYADVELLLTELNSAGFTNLNVGHWQGRLPIGGGLAPAQAADFALNAFAFGEPLLEAGETIFEKAKAELAKAFNAYTHQGKVMMNAYVHIVTGQNQP